MNVSLRKLAIDLGVDKDELCRVAHRAGGLYRSFDVRGLGSGKWRHIDQPQDELANVQRRVLRRILERAELPASMTGGLPRRSLLDHARPHSRQPIVVTLDLAHCFPSIDHRRVFDIFKERLGFSSSLANLLTKLTTLRRRLPQGASTSPYLAALATEAMHSSVLAFCRERDLCFTQFVDDLAISGPDGCQALIPEVIGLVQRHGFGLSRAKVRIMAASECQTVTGIVVNRGLSAGSERIQTIKDELEAHRDALFILVGEKRSLDGKLAFVNSVRPAQAERLRKFALHCLPATTEGLRFLSSSSIERRGCYCTRRHERSRGSPRASEQIEGSQTSLPGLGRRAFIAARSTPKRPTRRAKQGKAVPLGQQELPLRVDIQGDQGR